MDRPLGSQLSEANVNQRLLSQLQQQYPAFARQRVTVTQGPGEYYSETAPLGEPFPYNPTPSTHNITIYPMGQALPEADKQQLIGGEMLHILGAKNPRTEEPFDPGWYAQKQAFLNTMTPQQLTTDRFAYGARPPEDKRTFADWMDNSREDAYLRAGLFPMQTGMDPAWLETFTPEQRALLDSMQQYLRTPNAPSRR